MNSFVLDASAVLGWILDRPPATGAAPARELILAGAKPVVPAIWLHEVTNAVVVAERRGRLTAAQVATVTTSLEEFFEYLEVDSRMVRASVLIEAARRTSLAVYDAAYLELASHRKLPLATLDEKLRKAARHAGVALI